MNPEKNLCDELAGCPYLTAETAPVALTFKRSCEDFRVEEIPAYEPSGQGDHVYFDIEKKNVTTHEAVARIAKALGVARAKIGYAGLKDAVGVTRQRLSLEHGREEDIRALKWDDLQVLDVMRHRNKIKTGHLAGNRFLLKLRGIAPARFADLESLCEKLTRTGVPNYYGLQRFGARGDTWKIGKALIEENWPEAAACLAGRPQAGDFGPVLKAREYFDAGDYKKSLDSWPRGHAYASQLCQHLIRTQGDFRRSIFSIDRKMLRFFVSAYQSYLFNAVLAARIESLDRMLEGDWAHKHETHGQFLVEQADVESPRAERFEISATGPLFGKKMRETTGAAAALEKQVLDGLGADSRVFSKPGPLVCDGGRRPLRFKPEGLKVTRASDSEGEYAALEVVLPAGCYVTMLLREIAKDELTDASRAV